MTLVATIPLKHDIPFTPLLRAKPRRTDVLATRILFLLCQTYYPTKKPQFSKSIIILLATLSFVLYPSLLGLNERMHGPSRN